MKAINQTNDQLNALFAEHVCKYRRTEEPDHWANDNATLFWIRPKDGRVMIGESWRSDSFEAGKWSHSWSHAKFTESLDAILPWLDKMAQWNIEFVSYDKEASKYFCRVWKDRISPREPDTLYRAFSETAQKAAMIAMLKHFGVEVEYT